MDHSSTLYEFYVLGEKVFYAVKKSTPNADILMKLSESNGLKPLVIDRYVFIASVCFFLFDNGILDQLAFPVDNGWGWGGGFTHVGVLRVFFFFFP